jgi:hypothetical protein
MSNADLETKGPYWKTAGVLWAVSLVGLALVFPYVITLESAALAAASKRMHLGVPALLAISALQSAVLLAVAVLVGLWASRKLGLRTPLISAFLTGQPAPRRTGWTLLLAIALGALGGVALYALDRFVFMPFPSVAELVRHATATGTVPGPLQGFLASFYGALDEEILMRLGLLSVLALILRSVTRLFGANGEVPLPASVFWMANIAAAVLFGLGHLPATAALAPLTPVLVVRAIVLNGTVGLLFGALYRRYGLEWAMASHFGADILLHVV